MALPNISLEEKVAIVTGGRGGIGRAIALRFAEAGAGVAICDYVADDELDAVAEEIRKLGQRSIAVQVDVTDKASVNNLVQKVEAELGNIDILANVAGVLNISSLVDLPEEEWDRVMVTNLKGYYLMCQAVVKGMIKRKKGAIVNIASADAYNPIPYQVAYNCSKTGVVMLTNTLAFEVGRYNIRVNAIAPGFVWTPMSEYLKSDPAALKDTVAQLALGHLGEPYEIANVAAFLASDLASFVTGATWRVDGGTNPPSLESVPGSKKD